MKAVSVWRTEGRPRPIVASLPHAGRAIPAEFATDMALVADDLVSDWHTGQLYEFLPTLGVPAVVNNLSRWVADPNRDPISATEGPAPRAVVASHDFHGRPLYGRPIGEAAVQARVAGAHRPYHEALDDLVAEARRIHGRALVLDLHCFAAPLEAEVIIGDRRGTTAAPTVVDAVEAALVAAGFSCARNVPGWAGAWIVEKYGSWPDVDAVQIELDARTYVDPAVVGALPPLPPVEPARYQQTQKALQAFLVSLLQDYETSAAGPEPR